ncbi:MAG: L,D-transpeptidase [Arenimonas sp.]
MAQDSEVMNVASETTSSQDFDSMPVSAEIREMKQWVIDSRDNHKLPFILIDKINAKVYLFNYAGQLQGAAPALLGSARGDHTIPDIGNRSLSEIGAEDRITPAGRFVSSLSYDMNYKQILVLDDAQALSLHPVVKGTPAEQRAERLQSSTPQDNRISFGCINVPVQFFSDAVSPAFAGTNGIVYILPESSSMHTLFGMDKRQNDVSGTNRSNNPLLNLSAKGKGQNNASGTNR